MPLPTLLDRRRRPRLADPIHRLTERWRSGGVEEYCLGAERGAHSQALRRMGRGFEVTKHRIRMEILPQAFHGLRIAQLSDIHHGLYLPGEPLRHVVETVNELQPDIVAVTGDFVTYSRAYIEPVAEILGSLRTKYGIFAVLGNHDFRVAPEEISGALQHAGIEVLRNRHVRLRAGGESLYLAGIDDLHYRADLPRALRGIPKGAASILLSHNPAIIRAASRAQVGLVLSGHTHGGQVNLPLVGSIYGRSAESLRFKVGWARLGPTQIYVSRGIGTIVLPMRFRCPAEITHLALDSAHAA